MIRENKYFFGGLLLAVCAIIFFFFALQNKVESGYIRSFSELEKFNVGEDFFKFKIDDKAFYYMSINPVVSKNSSAH